MPEARQRAFEIVCNACGRSLMTVERLRDPEIGALVRHFRTCAASEWLREKPALGEVMARIRVAAVDRR